MEIKTFKIHPSSSGKIMGVKGLGKTGQSLCETWLKEQIYGRKQQFTSKYTDKGLIVEDDSLDFTADHLGCGLLIKNETRYENDFMKGTPDIVTPKFVLDVKNPSDCFTFPLFDDEVPNSDYYFQGQCYMNLTGVHAFKLVYVLSDTPANLIEREARYFAKQQGYDVDQQLMDEFVARMTYGGIDKRFKIRVFDIEYNPAAIEAIQNRVIECRAYIDTLIEKINA